MNSAAPEPIRDVVILRIAEGGMGYIELVARRQGRFSRLFARKRLHAYLRSDATFRAMFLDEARLAGLIRHPNVAAALDVGEDGEGPFLLMDYVDGPSVAEILERFQPRDGLLPVAFCVVVAAQAARGLHAAHELVSAQGAPLGVVHRDISPKNLLVGYDGLVRVVDFGIAKANDNLEQTRVGVLKGNVGYMAPEYLRFQDLDGRSDLFALGVVLYEMLTRERLYGGDDTAAIARRILDEPAPDIFERRDVPPELAALLFDLMAKDRVSRPASALAAAARLDQIAGDLATVDGAFDIITFLEAELAPMRDERRALVDAALNAAASEARSGVVELPSGQVAAPGAAAAAAAAAAAGAAGAAGDVGTSASLTVSDLPRTLGGARRRWYRRAPIVATLVLVVAAGVAWPWHRLHERAAAKFVAGEGQLWGGGWHTCAQRGRQLICWGSNIRGQLGDGTQDSRATPIVAPISDVRGVALGEYHTCVVTAEGHVSCWGRNVRGELGHPAPTLSKVPLEVPGVTGVRAVAAGRQHTCALHVDGRVTCWGANDSGQLGRAPSPTDQSPAPIADLPPAGEIFAGGSNTCATVAGGRLLCWGANESGQLGDASHEARAAALPVPGAEGIPRVAIGNGARAGRKNPDLSKSAGFMCGVRARDGNVLCWGNNANAQLGDGTREDRPTPQPVRGITDAIDVEVGDVHACALRRTGHVSCWGRNEFGVVGDGSMGPSNIRLVPVEARVIEDAVGIALGDAHSCARRRTGAVLCWGVNNFGQLGEGTNLLRPAPFPTIGLP